MDIRRHDFKLTSQLGVVAHQTKVLHVGAPFPALQMTNRHVVQTNRDQLLVRLALRRNQSILFAPVQRDLGLRKGAV